MSKTTTVRGVVASPFQHVRALAVPSSKSVRVNIGRTYELRTDAQTLLTVDGDTVGVLYPLAYVGEGGGGGTNNLTPAAGTPFSRVSPVVVTPQSDTLLISADIACNVWVLQVSEPCDEVRLATPGGCGCSPKPKAKAGCGCSA